jgi:hypothetical protein
VDAVVLQDPVPVGQQVLEGRGFGLEGGSLRPYPLPSLPPVRWAYRPMGCHHPLLELHDVAVGVLHRQRLGEVSLLLLLVLVLAVSAGPPCRCTAGQRVRSI